MMGLPGNEHSENNPDRPEVGGIGNGFGRVLLNLSCYLSNDMKKVMMGWWWWWPKESEFADLVVDGCSVLSLSLSLSPLAARGRFMIAFIITQPAAPDTKYDTMSVPPPTLDCTVSSRRSTSRLSVENDTVPLSLL
jgi:hypothetical protein